MRFIEAKSEREVELIRKLFREYESAIGLSLCFQNFEAELADLPGKYAGSAGGKLLLAYVGQDPAGCGAFRRLAAEVCEMKRVFIRPQFRRSGAGRALVVRLIDEARAAGYAAMRLDTIRDKMPAAVNLYESLGFHRIEPYYDSPHAEAFFMEKQLSADSSQARPKFP